jgi:chromosome segregation protein
MDDVIFAGTAKRPALGRAEVSLTIDNSSGLLGVEFSEVTITRSCSAAATASTRSTGCRAGCSTSKSCCPTPAWAVSST